MPELKGFGLHPETEQEFRALLEEKFSALTFAECCELFAAVDACVEPVLGLDEASEHSLFEAREMVADVPTPDGGTQRQIAAAVKFSGSAPSYKQIGAALGEHTEEVLRELGKSDGDIDRLAKAGCFS